MMCQNIVCLIMTSIKLLLEFMMHIESLFITVEFVMRTEKAFLIVKSFMARELLAIILIFVLVAMCEIRVLSKGMLLGLNIVILIRSVSLCTTMITMMTYRLIIDNLYFCLFYFWMMLKSLVILMGVIVFTFLLKTLSTLLNRMSTIILSVSPVVFLALYAVFLFLCELLLLLQVLFLKFASGLVLPLDRLFSFLLSLGHLMLLCSCVVICVQVSTSRLDLGILSVLYR